MPNNLPDYLSQKPRTTLRPFTEGCRHDMARTSPSKDRQSEKWHCRNCGGAAWFKVQD